MTACCSSPIVFAEFMYVPEPLFESSSATYWSSVGEVAMGLPSPSSMIPIP